MNPAMSPDTRKQGEGFSHFDGDVALYDSSKPVYPNDLVTRIVTAMPGRDILNVGCGTGIEARQFQAAGCAVLGVDPDERMAEFARGTGVPVETSRFETWMSVGRTFDAVVAGTAWHWVDPGVGVAKAAQVLRPGGLLAPFHHAQHTPPRLEAVGDGLPAWSSRSAEAYRRVAPDSVFDPGGRRRSSMELYQMLFDEFANQIRQADGFSEPEQWQFGWERTYTRDEWLDLLPTYGAVAKLPPAELARVLERVGAAIDEMGGSFSLPFTTIAVIAVRKDTD
ncbi:class I SAM-dependent methyltransferase [Mangrovihabitans endophyticus]|uniref:Methyltransferase type 11 n=1 Tax=Mangrovihabitans endophyticus TaxID=1751298 RepID=A0A8J3FKU0_9ACTN|nr:class I SAM-dependent methyltransferase [Mangrovihabitans endophyticus]GGK72794.1 methyltransferase type 11 [Mangrovihabitans endophyticus]